MEGVPVAVVERRIHLHLEGAHPALQQQLRPPINQLHRHHGRRRGVGEAERGRQRTRVQNEGVRAAGEQTEADGGRETRLEWADPRPSRAREGPGQHLAAGPSRPLGADAPAPRMGIELSLYTCILKYICTAHAC